MTSSPISAAPPARRAATLELVVVFGLTVGVSWISNITSALGGHPPAETAFSTLHLVSLLIYEAIVAALLVPWLARRGWSVRDAGAPEPFDVVRGIAVWFYCEIVVIFVWWSFAIVQPSAAQALATAHPFAGGATQTWVILASVLNPIFEEFLWLGYGIGALESRVGLRTACVVSVTLRVSVHAYQGPLAILSILPVGLVLTLSYASSRRLWPVIVAHVVMDAIGLAQFLAPAT